MMQADLMYNYLNWDPAIHHSIGRYHGVLRHTRKIIREIDAHQAHE
ncbi:hypothetical protein [Hymenobacter armeniacus]|uniref:Uncharacterized protein n=1 Tax=Hymenobacter armeniacus TaxID=2771358 RepID=A0ABR8JP34_9BACT|nr:hypothetical protein [Hymenobacter armeniacus]MBD2721761.1 hypothetical protein [Hymenobacter armeniacus]